MGVLEVERLNCRCSGVGVVWTRGSARSGAPVGGLGGDSLLSCEHVGQGRDRKILRSGQKLKECAFKMGWGAGL